MFGLGLGEFVIILVIVVVLFSRRLPEIGENLGKSVRKFRRAFSEGGEIDVTPKDERDKKN